MYVVYRFSLVYFLNNILKGEDGKWIKYHLIDLKETLNTLRVS